MALRIFVSDGQAEISDDFVLTVNPVNDAPVVAEPLADISASELSTGELFAVPIPDGTFIDPDGDPLAFAATLATGEALPDWMNFSGTVLSGIAPTEAVGDWDIRILATDGDLQSEDIFTMSFALGNEAPIAVDDGPFETRGDVATHISENTLLSNDSDPDGDPLSITAVGQGAHGSVSLRDDGRVTYTPDTGFVGQDQFIYQITDGNSVGEATVTIDVGEPYDNTETGGSGSDVLIGDFSGDNNLAGGGGDDILISGGGDDNLSGGGGSDVLISGSGDDTVTGGGGSDLLFAGSGDDLLSGGGGSDSLFGGRGDDVLRGGAGDDLLIGGAGIDRLAGGSGDDLLLGGSSEDRLIGGSGNDLLYGGSGSDIFVFREGDGADVIGDYQTPRSGRRFNIEGDQIHLSFEGVDNFDQLLAVAQEQDGGVLFEFGDGDEIFLSGTQLSALDRDSFTFF